MNWITNNNIGDVLYSFFRYITQNQFVAAVPSLVNFSTRFLKIVVEVF